MVRGEVDATTPTLVRVHVQNPLADALHWRRPDFGPAVGDVLATIAREGRGALVLLGDNADAETLLARVRQPSPADPDTTVPGHALAEWRRNGAGAQILSDLGLGKLRVLGTPRKQVGLAGFGLEVVEYVELSR
jgi:3,4-dihydroxy 2-butanone 4-phosphate synthase/GTP cyclohydrolase II